MAVLDQLASQLLADEAARAGDENSQGSCLQICLDTLYLQREPGKKGVRIYGYGD
jgi:hypothetical protein